MEILFVTSELAPYSRHSDAADVVAALPKALRSLGHKVTVVSPLYAGIDPTARSLARRLSTLSVEALGRTHTCTVFDGRTTAGVDVVFLANTELFGNRGPGEGSPEERALASVVLSAAAAELAHKREPAIDVLHAHGAVAALSLAYAKALRPELPCVLSVHDGSAEEPLTAAELEKLTLPAHIRNAFDTQAKSLLGAGIRVADLVVVSSQSRALSLKNEPQTGLGALLRDKAERLLGIANGVDASIWNPLTDSHLSARFDPVNLKGKTQCKGSLQYAAGLAVVPEVPLIVAIGDLSAARGGDVIAQLAPQLLRNEVQLLVLDATGQANEKLATLAAEQPERVAVRTKWSEKEYHLALAGSDFLLLPAREPQGLDVALCALRYGSLPIVRPTGVLADMIVDADAKLETGNGFVAQGEGEDEVLGTIQRALAAHANHAAFEAMRRRVMRTDVSWERSARRYEYAYRQLKNKVAQPSAA